jgi:hypothetical protein
LLSYQTATIIPLYGASSAATYIIIKDKNLQTKTYKSSSHNEALIGILMLPFLSGRNLLDVRRAQTQLDIQKAAIEKPEINYATDIDERFIASVCESDTK